MYLINWLKIKSTNNIDERINFKFTVEIVNRYFQMSYTPLTLFFKKIVIIILDLFDDF